jgi:hypothetical protein
MSKKLSAIIVFFIALLVRLFLIIQPQNNFLGGNDAIGYNNAAVHLVKGENNFGFFREPGYVYFIGGVYYIWESLGGSVKEISSEFFNQQQNPEILFLRVIQALFSSLTILLFYFLIRVFIKNQIAIWIAIISGLYMPLANMPLFVLRETIQFFILMLLNLILLKYFITRQLKYLAISGVLWGISNLMLQITYLVFIPYLIVFLFIVNRNLLFTIRDFVICSVFMLVIILPWVYKSYKYYPDYRILKTMGVSLTFESLDYINKLRNSRDRGFISNLQTEEQLKKEWYLISDSLRFERSFQGYYKSKADSVEKVLNGSDRKMGFIIQRAFMQFRLSMMQTFFWNNSDQQIKPLSFYLHHKRLPFVIIYILFSYMSILGIILFSRKLLLLLPLFIFFSSLFYFIGSETRRMLFIHPFLIMFSTLAIVTLYLRVFKKADSPAILNTIFNKIIL